METKVPMSRRELALVSQRPSRPVRSAAESELDPRILEIKRQAQKDLATINQPRVGSIYTLPAAVLVDEEVRPNVAGGQRNTVLKRVVRGVRGGYKYYPVWTDQKTGALVRGDKAVYMSKKQLDTIKPTKSIPGCLSGCATAQDSFVPAAATPSPSRRSTRTASRESKRRSGPVSQEDKESTTRSNADQEEEEYVGRLEQYVEQVEQENQRLKRQLDELSVATPTPTASH
jgi:hypothetical protein